MDTLMDNRLMNKIGAVRMDTLMDNRLMVQGWRETCTGHPKFTWFCIGASGEVPSHFQQFSFPKSWQGPFSG